MLSKMGANEDIEKVIQEKYARYLNLKQSLEAYQLLYETNRQRLEEVLLTISALEGLKKKNIGMFDGFVSIGSGIFIRIKGSLSKKVLMGMGANIAVEVEIDDAISKLKERESNLRQELTKIQNMINQLVSTIYKLEEEIVKLQKYLK